MLWDQSLETGIKQVDDQHKELFRQIDILLDVSKANRVNETMNFLDSYIVKHFSDEQKLHLQSNYPKAILHKGYHDNYVITFRQLKSKLQREGSGLLNTMEVNRVVVDWLKNHILVHDKEFAQYYRSVKK